MQRAFEMELKVIAPTGEFEGLASTYGNVDDVGDVVVSGAFQKTLQSSKERPLLYNHRDAIGLVTLQDSPAGLIAKGKLSLGVQLAKDVYALLKDRVISKMSIGYETIKADYKGNVRYLSEIKLWEVSLVVIPANQMAAVTSVKSFDPQIESALREFKNDIFKTLSVKGQR